MTRVERLVESKVAILELTEQQAQLLRDAGKRMASPSGWKQPVDSEPSIIECEPYGAEQWRVRVQNAVGVVTVPGVELVVAPKIPVAHLLHLFDKSGHFPRVDDSDAELESADSLWSLLATWFLNAVEPILQAGLYSDYRSERDDLRVVRGKVMVAATMRSSFRGRIDIGCEFEEFDADSPLNRVLRAAAATVSRSRVLDRRLRSRAIRVTGQMDGVGDLRSSDTLAAPDRLTSSYLPAWQFALHILRAAGRGLDAGSERGWTFLIRTPDMIEEGLRRIIADEFAAAVKVTKRRLFLSGSHHSLTPDLCFGQSAVGDVKYKLWSGDWDRADLYQLVTFATGFGVTQGLRVGFRHGHLDRARVNVGPVSIQTCDWPCLVSDPQEAELQFRAHVQTWWQSLGEPSAA